MRPGAKEVAMSRLPIDREFSFNVSTTLNVAHNGRFGQRAHTRPGGRRGLTLRCLHRFDNGHVVDGDFDPNRTSFTRVHCNAALGFMVTPDI